MVAYYLQMQPHLFRSAVESEFVKLKEQREAEEQQEEQEQQGVTGSELVLYRCAVWAV
jgi:hypothetical protein